MDADGLFEPAAVGRFRRPGEGRRRRPRHDLRDRGVHSGASAILIPLLNQANIPQISPSNTYVGLTAKASGTMRHEPGLYYPAGKRTYFRLAGDDRVQGAALAEEMRADGCTRAVIARDGDLYGRMVDALARRAAKRIGLPVVAGTRGESPAEVAAAAKRAAADCFLFAGVTANRAAPTMRAVAAELPAARLYGGDGICYDEFTRRVRGLADRFECTSGAMPAEQYPGGAAFLDALGRMDPDPYAIWGYEAMKLGLDTIAALGGRGARREALRRALLATRDRDSVLGTYSILPSGDTTLRTFGVYRATPEGAVAFDHAVTAP